MEKPANIKTEYRKYIRDFVNAQKRDGFIGYWGSMKASSGAEQLLDKAEYLEKEKKYSEAIEIYQAVIETLVPVIPNADDSSGTIGDAINNAVEGVQKCSALVEPAEKDRLFNYLVKEADKKQYHGWDWELDLLNIAAELADDDRKTRILFDQLDAIGRRKDEEGRPVSEFTHEHLLKLKGIVLKKRGLVSELQTLIRDNINLTVIRELAILDAIDNNRLKEAKTLAVAGLNLAEQQKRSGRKETWYKWLLEIARKETNTEDIKKYSEALFIDSGEMEYYEELRFQYPASEWPGKALKLLKDVPEKICAIRDIPGKIYVREENWAALLSFARQRTSLYFLTSYHEHLIKHFPKELSELYGQALRKEIADAHDRSGYRRLCRIIPDMEECGFKEDVKALAEWIRKTYPVRTALQEELRKVIKDRY